MATEPCPFCGDPPGRQGYGVEEVSRLPHVREEQKYRHDAVACANKSCPIYWVFMTDEEWDTRRAPLKKEPRT